MVQRRLAPPVLAHSLKPGVCWLDCLNCRLKLLAVLHVLALHHHFETSFYGIEKFRQHQGAFFGLKKTFHFLVELHRNLSPAYSRYRCDSLDMPGQLREF